MLYHLKLCANVGGKNFINALEHSFSVIHKVTKRLVSSLQSVTCAEGGFMERSINDKDIVGILWKHSGCEAY